jgi:hypothetical protein
MVKNTSTVVGQSVNELLLAVGAICRAKHLTDLVPGHATNARSSYCLRQRFSMANDARHGSLSEVDASTTQSPF